MTIKHAIFFALTLSACGPECGDETTPAMELDYAQCAEDFAVGAGDSCDSTVDEDCMAGGDTYECVDGEWLVTIHAPLEDCG
jgi:hypothetical protein